MITWVGLCAGEVWRYLESRRNHASIQDLYKGIQAPKETILMAVGWLAREGYVLIEGTIDDFKVKLNPNPKKH